MMLGRFKLDILGLVAITIMIVGCYFLIQERKMCEDPIGNIIKPYLEKENITNYDLIVVEVYQSHGDSFPIKTMELYSKPIIPYKKPEINYSGILIE